MKELKRDEKKIREKSEKKIARKLEMKDMKITIEKKIYIQKIK